MDWLCRLLESTTFLTVVSGTLVFVLGQIFIEFVLKPIRKFKELKADAAFCLRFHRATFHNYNENIEAQNAAKKLAAKCIAYTQEKPGWYLGVSHKDLVKCCEQFTRLHYIMGGHGKGDFDGNECEKTIVKVLKIKWTS